VPIGAPFVLFERGGEWVIEVREAGVARNWLGNRLIFNPNDGRQSVFQRVLNLQISRPLISRSALTMSILKQVENRLHLLLTSNRHHPITAPQMEGRSGLLNLDLGFYCVKLPLEYEPRTLRLPGFAKVNPVRRKYLGNGVPPASQG
jgi:hypothetical protein